MELDGAISFGLDLGADFVDIREQEILTTSIEIVDGTVRTLSTGKKRGYGIRSFCRGAWGFSVTHGTGKELLKKAVEDSVRLAKFSSSLKEERFDLEGKRYEGKVLTSQAEPPSEVLVEGKLRKALEFEKAARIDERIRNVTVRYNDVVIYERVQNSFGTKVEQKIPRVNCYVFVYASEAGITERAFESIGGTVGFEILRTDKAAVMSEKAARRAVELLAAKSAPAGPYKAVLDQKLAGIFIHEAFGHATEADSVLAKMSVLEGRIGTQIGSELVDVIDDPTIPNLYGSYPFDDEGTPSRKKYLVKEGILMGFMHSLETSSRMKQECTGNGRSMSYSNPPMVRMSNTFIAKGDWKFEELLEDIDEGIYAKGGLYGYTDPSKGQFMFKAEEGWMIRKGELVERLREVAITGMTLEVLHNIDAVADDLEMRIGHCGKGGQWVPTTAGSPHVRVKRMIFGGLR
ncbi:MAG TPA: TldD/PmbA family protein [Candidatus Korarchaeota archaeon]|nr:TldD/PmbA family protein [Candidatus Korarchaeota archaeon]